MGLIKFISGRANLGSRGVALIVASAVFMINLDSAIINTSLPQMGRSFGAPAVEVNAGIAAYLLAVAAFVPLSGWISDRFGSKYVFGTAIAVFALSSVACGTATSLWVFILARVVQGLGGALMTPVGRIVVLRHAEKQEIMQATALITWPSLIAPVVGPVIGGAITTWVNWRWNFLLNAPLGLVGLLLVLAYVPNYREPERRPLDLVGCLLTSASLILLIYGLEELSHSGAGVSAAIMLSVALVLGIAAIVWFRKVDHPLLDLRPFANTTFCVATLDAGILQRIAISATPFLLPLMLQVVWKLNPLQAGMIVLVYFCANLAMKAATTALLRWFGFKPVLAVNGFMVVATVVMCGFLTRSTAGLLVDVAVVLAGAARSLQLTALTTLGFAEVPGDQRAAASTLSSMLQQVAQALGVSLAAVLLHASQSLHHGGALSMDDFRLGFIGVGAFALVGALCILRLAPDAGWEVSGHRASARATSDLSLAQGDKS